MAKILAAVALTAAFTLLAMPLARAADSGEIPAHPTLAQAINGSWRTPAFVKRDKYRHPLKVLEFFGMQPDMSVVEIDPGGGWWTEFLAPYLKADGQLTETVPPEGATGFMGKTRKNFLAKLKASPELYSKVKTVPFAPPKTVQLGPAGSADMVITFRNMHDWLNADDGAAKSVFKAAWKVLKPGGVFGVTDHRALPFANGRESAKKLHRIPEDFVIEMGLNAGFRLAGVSQVNRNPKDPMTINIHHLPPNLAHDTAAQKKRYLKIGESDVFVMKFVKPETGKNLSGSVGD